MSEMEKKELASRIKAMDFEEQMLAAELLPSEIMWKELKKRFDKMDGTVYGIKQALKQMGE